MGQSITAGAPDCRCDNKSSLVMHNLVITSHRKYHVGRGGLRRFKLNRSKCEKMSLKGGWGGELVRGPLRGGHGGGSTEGGRQVPAGVSPPAEGLYLAFGGGGIQPLVATRVRPEHTDRGDGCPRGGSGARRARHVDSALASTPSRSCKSLVD